MLRLYRSDLYMGFNRIARIQRGAMNDIGPEIIHLLQMRLPLTMQLGLEDRTEHVVALHFYIERIHNLADKLAADHNLTDRNENAVIFIAAHHFYLPYLP